MSPGLIFSKVAARPNGKPLTGVAPPRAADGLRAKRGALEAGMQRLPSTAAQEARKTGGLIVSGMEVRLHAASLVGR